jgi:hypothetical protein
MIRIAATVRGGVIVPSEPLDWPDGTEVEVHPVCELADDEIPDSPEEIVRWIAEFNAIPPLQMTDEEEAAWIADRKAQRDFDASMAEAREAKIRKGLE